MADNPPFDLNKTYLRLRSDGSTETLAVDDTFWRELAGGKFGTFKDEYLISSHMMDGNWDMWERHPGGDEVVCLLAGAVIFQLEYTDGCREIVLSAVGEYAVIPKGTWHTARTSAPSQVLFITPGEGTEHRAIQREE